MGTLRAQAAGGETGSPGPGRIEPPAQGERPPPAPLASALRANRGRAWCGPAAGEVDAEVPGQAAQGSPGAGAVLARRRMLGLAAGLLAAAAVALLLDWYGPPGAPPAPGQRRRWAPQPAPGAAAGSLLWVVQVSGAERAGEGRPSRGHSGGARSSPGYTCFARLPEKSR